MDMTQDDETPASARMQMESFGRHVLLLGPRPVDEILAIARSYHARAGDERPFMPLTWAGMPDRVVESEIFGHVRDGFPGAFRDKPGALEVAAGGTLVLMDDVETLPPAVTSRLTRALMTRHASRLGRQDALYPLDVSLVGTLTRSLDRSADHALTQLCAYFTIIHTA
jgi:transcriptional regulator with GAF, ATPase, and Fis domain